MKPKNYLDLLSKLATGTEAPNPVDMLILHPLLEPEGSMEDLSDAPEIGELIELSRLALSDNTASAQPAQAALFALRQSVASDEACDRQEGIRQSETLLKHIDAMRFPVTAAGAHLKIGGALAINVHDHDGPDRDDLTHAITHFERALEILPEQSVTMRAIAAYNAALAFHNLWRSSDDWDGEEGARDKALSHGMVAINAMNHGLAIGNRESVSRVVLSILLADGEPRDNHARKQIIDFLQAWLDSPEGKTMPRTTRSALREVRNSLAMNRDAE